ncbi:MAG: hypothetical protein JNM84_07280, partial [Planctomycetes bacterium]|nr:hypothetical protein [Planctomycetota bacterium]
PERLDANGPVVPGNAAFALRCAHAPESSLGALLLSRDADLAGSDPLGIGLWLHVGLPGLVATLPFPSDARGLASLALPIPPDPTLSGGVLHAQALFSWSAPCAPTSLGLSSSSGLTLRAN